MLVSALYCDKTLLGYCLEYRLLLGFGYGLGYWLGPRVRVLFGYMLGLVAK